MEFKVGDKIKVIDNRRTYETYNIWINKYAIQYKQNWKKNQLPSENNEYILKVKAPHTIFNREIYLIQDIKTKQVYMIDDNGIELVKENKKFFKRLPNDHTGTTEVENGYIVEKEILDEEEKEYLSAVIRPFKDRVEYIKKRKSAGEFIAIYMMEDSTLMFPNFDKGTMYKGMETDKAYTLKELGLD